ncbi:serine/threonine-protein phosphatase 6 regulatory ankyrin repeat subunit A-like [Uloborus diversus]|uniref:serine/threonine-protein phosphatase 6 regulatory ankyrin repeat subunit A-like n=1 Tax=Uloborus diversus TaxID=327109 RepID=UPI002409EBD2|nr:serine/threonine-protein phosphatase 6 regulatory ankyrin repeat subunit A-like [Uloborus diversus]
MNSAEEAVSAVSRLAQENAELREQLRELSEKTALEMEELRRALGKAQRDLENSSTRCGESEAKLPSLATNAGLQKGETGKELQAEEAVSAVLRLAQENAELREQLRELSEKTALENEELRKALGKAQRDLEISNARCRELEAKLRPQATNAGLQKGETGKELQGSGRGADGELPSTSKRQSRDGEGEPPRRRRPEDGGASETDEYGRTALHHAAMSGDTEEIRALLDRGLDTRTRDVYGETPLHLALFHEKDAAAEVLTDVDSITDVVNDDGLTPLHHAAGSGFVNVVRMLLAGGADASAKDGYGRTPLHHAVSSGKEAAAEVLLGAAPECDGPDMEGRTPLHYAVRGLPRIVQSLLSRGARLKFKDEDGHCPLDHALRCKQDGVARVLLATYAWNDIVIHWEEMELPQDDEERGVRLLSECEAEMRKARVEGSRLSLRDLARRPPSRLARRLSDEAIRRLSDRDLLARDFPLFGDLLLVRLGEVRERRALEDRFLRCFPLLCPPLPTTCTDVLLACLADDDLRIYPQKEKERNPGGGRGADGELPSMSKRQSQDGEGQPPRRRRPEDEGASETDKYGRTALHRAAMDEDTERIRELLEGGWNTRARDLNGMTPLHLALLYEKEAAAELLADADCITDVVDFYKRTPLHLAAECGFVNVVRILLAGGANASAKDRSESTPLHFAVISRMEAAAEVLLEAAAECDGPDMEGRTPLHYAVREGLPRIVQSLLSRGARFKLKDEDGLCPLYRALMRGHDGAARVLLATYAWMNIEVHWEEMQLSKDDEERGVRLLSECEADMRVALTEGSRLSLRDLARRHPSRLARRLSDEAIRRLSDRDLLARDFPLFGDLLLVRLGEVRERRALEDRFLRCFPLLCRPLPPTCTDVLLACLADDDLRHFARAAEL